MPAFLGGISLGKWIDEDGDGRYDTLEIETRGFKGPRAVDLSGTPLHEDNQTVIKERLSLDKADPNLLHNRITIEDHALTQPWMVTKNYRRGPNPRPYWRTRNALTGTDRVLFVRVDGDKMTGKSGLRHRRRRQGTGERRATPIVREVGQIDYALGRTGPLRVTRAVASPATHVSQMTSISSGSNATRVGAIAGREAGPSSFPRPRNRAGSRQRGWTSAAHR